MPPSSATPLLLGRVSFAHRVVEAVAPVYVPVRELLDRGLELAQHLAEDDLLRDSSREHAQHQDRHTYQYDAWSIHVCPLLQTCKKNGV